MFKVLMKISVYPTKVKKRTELIKRCLNVSIKDFSFLCRHEIRLACILQNDHYLTFIVLCE